MPSLERIARARANAILRQADRLDDQGVLRALRLLDDLRRTVLGELVGAVTEYQRGVLEELLRATDRAVGEFRTRYATQLISTQARLFDLGALAVDAPLAGVSTTYLGPVISRQLVEVLQNYSADLVRHVSDAARAAISDEIRLGTIAGRPAHEVIERIGTHVNRGRFASIAKRAETITRTEHNRALSMATFLRLGQAAQRLPGLQQMWTATLDERTRPTHRDAHDQVRAIGEPFDVGEAQLRFPGDPAGPPEETINCRCRVVPFSANWQDVVSPTDAITEVPGWLRERLGEAEVMLGEA